MNWAHIIISQSYEIKQQLTEGHVGFRYLAYIAGIFLISKPLDWRIKVHLSFRYSYSIIEYTWRCGDLFSDSIYVRRKRHC